MLTSNALRKKLWEKKTWVQMMQATTLGHLFNRGVVYFPEKFLTKSVKEAGDHITFGYVGKLTNVPVGEGGTLDGNEEALDLTSHSMVFNTSRIGVLNPNSDTIEQKRTEVMFEPTSVELVKRRAIELLDSSVWQQLCGNTTTSDITLNGTTYSSSADKLHIQGHNTPVAPSTNRIIRAGGVANDQSLGSSNIMALDLIDYAIEKISQSDQPIEFLDGQTFDLYCSPEQITDLYQNSSAKIKWYDFMFNKIAGGESNSEMVSTFKNNMICAGRYKNVYIYQANRITNGVSSADSSAVANTKRAVLVGRDAISFASPFGGRPTDKDVPMKVFNELKDYDYFKGIEGRLIYGIKKMTPSGKEDVGSLVISTYAASHG